MKLRSRVGRNDKDSNEKLMGGVKNEHSKQARSKRNTKTNSINEIKDTDSVISTHNLSNVKNINSTFEQSSVKYDHKCSLLKTCLVVVEPIATRECFSLMKERTKEKEKHQKAFKRSALVASTPLVTEVGSVQPSNLKSELSGSYWYDDSQVSQISKISLRENSQYQGNEILRSSGRKSRPVNKLQYTTDKKTSGKESNSGTGSGATPTRPGVCATRKLQFSQGELVSSNQKKKSRRVSFAKKKSSTSRRKSLSSKDYRRGSLVRKYLSSSSTFVKNEAKKNSNREACKLPLPPEGNNVGTDNVSKRTTKPSMADKKKNQFSSLSKTFTSISGKSAAKLYEESFVLQNYLQNTTTYLPNVSICSLNKADVSLLKKRRKKLYSQRVVEKFANSPLVSETEKPLKKSKENLRVKKNVSSKSCFDDIIEDTAQESRDEFSSIKVDDEISVCVKTSSFNDSISKSESMHNNIDGGYIIHSREKTRSATCGVANDVLDGSFTVCTTTADNYVPCNVVKQNSNSIPVDALKDANTNNCDRFCKPPYPVLDVDSKLTSDAKQNEENLLIQGSSMNVNTVGVKKKKKKRLHGKGSVVFDLEASINEERDRTFNVNVTCNQSILASAIQFNC